MNSAEGIVVFFDPARHFGFIQAEPEISVFFHENDLRGGSPSKGDRVRFNLIETAKGFQAKNIEIIARVSKQAKQSRNESEGVWHKHLTEALFAKQAGKHEAARAEFQKAIEAGATPHPYFPYVAMERQLKNLGRARKLLESALLKYPNHGKLYEEYSMMEAKEGNLSKAAVLLRSGIESAPDHHHVLYRLLGQTLFALGGAGNLSEALECFEKAEQLGSLDEGTKQDFYMARVLTGHPRGKEALEFFTRAGFVLSHIHVPPSRSAVDIFVIAKRPEYAESYDLVDQIFVRCLFNDTAENADVDRVIKDVNDATDTKPINKDIAFLVLQNASTVRDYLYAVVDRPGRNATIIPIDELLMKSSSQSGEAEASFKLTLDQWLYKRNLYDESFPVSGRRFFGRERELAYLSRSVDTGTPVGLFGLRKVGKTSLLKKLKEKRPQDLVIYIDLQAVPEGIRDTSFLYWEMANQIRSELRRKNIDLAKQLKFRLAGRYTSYASIAKTRVVSADFDADLRALREILSQSGEDSIKVVLLLDELERMVPTAGNPGFSGYSDFFAYLRGVSQQEGMLLSFVTGANPAIFDQPQWEGKDNPVFKFYREMFLPPFAQLECEQMVEKLGKGMGITFTNKALERIFEETGGHPFVARQLCSRIAKQFPERPLRVDVPTVELGLEEFLFHDVATFKEIIGRLERDFPQEKELLLFIASGVDTDRELSGLVQGGTHDALRHLIGYQLVDRVGTRYQIKIALFEKWIRRYWLGKE
jgi:tetratricopeptide (TPR) repeat protein